MLAVYPLELRATVGVCFRSNRIKHLPHHLICHFVYFPLNTSYEMRFPSYLLFPLLCYTYARTSVQAATAIKRLPFESSGDDIAWRNVNIRNNEQFASPDGKSYAIIGNGKADEVSGNVGVIEEGKRYTFRVWARSANPRGPNRLTVAQVKLSSPGEKVLASASEKVNAPDIQNDIISDDGGNVWVDGNWRIAAGNDLWAQRLDEDLHKKWRKQKGLPDAMAWGPYHDSGKTSLYGTYYFVREDDARGSRDECKSTRSRIDLLRLQGSPPNYRVPKPSGTDCLGSKYETVLSHVGDESPWVIDAHVYNDPDTNRMWLTWGGHALWISELDPATGRLMGNPKSTEFDTHPKGLHTCIMAWESGACPGADDPSDGDFEGDQFSSSYVEGPMLFKHNSYFHVCGSYGNMNADYTIRCCRSKNAHGPYVDKEGNSCRSYGKKRGRYGASMLLGDEGDHLVPGHPHIWQEGGRYFLGYDYRPYPLPSNDQMAFRELFWDENGWPTVWKPMELTFDARDFPEMVGKPLKISFSNGGNGASLAAFAAASLTVQPSTLPPPGNLVTPRPTSAPVSAIPCNPNKGSGLICKSGAIGRPRQWRACGKHEARRYCPAGWAMCSGGKCVKDGKACNNDIIHSKRRCEDGDSQCEALTCKASRFRDVCTRKKCSEKVNCATSKLPNGSLTCVQRSSLSRDKLCAALTRAKKAYTRQWCRRERKSCKLAFRGRKLVCIARPVN